MSAGWRVVLVDGRVWEITTCAPAGDGSGGWLAYREADEDACGEGGTETRAVADLVSDWVRRHDVREILAPGELTRAEAVAAITADRDRLQHAHDELSRARRMDVAAARAETWEAAARVCNYVERCHADAAVCLTGLRGDAETIDLERYAGVTARECATAIRAAAKAGA